MVGDLYPYGCGGEKTESAEAMLSTAGFGFDGADC